MPGYQSKFVGTPPAPPNKCAICQLSESPEIKYFMDTGVWAEHEGVIYLCDRCFEPLVTISERFILIDEYQEKVSDLNTHYEMETAKLSDMNRQADLLHDIFGLRLSDLDKFKTLTEKLTNLQLSVDALDISKKDREIQDLKERSEVEERRILIGSLDAQIEEKRRELDIFVSDSLTTKLDHIGRSDLIDIILNNRFPEEVFRSPDGNEQPSDESIRESLQPSASF